jgi:hypothetical protein
MQLPQPPDSPGAVAAAAASPPPDMSYLTKGRYGARGSGSGTVEGATRPI